MEKLFCCLVVIFISFFEVALSQETLPTTDLATQLITPLFTRIDGVRLPPTVSSDDSVQEASLRLLSIVAILVKSQSLNRETLNKAFDAYNNLIVLLGITDPKQIKYFPKLHNVGVQLNSLRKAFESEM